MVLLISEIMNPAFFDINIFVYDIFGFIFLVVVS